MKMSFILSSFMFLMNIIRNYLKISLETALDRTMVLSVASLKQLNKKLTNSPDLAAS